MADPNYMRSLSLAVVAPLWRARSTFTPFCPPAPTPARASVVDVVPPLMPSYSTHPPLPTSRSWRHRQGWTIRRRPPTSTTTWSSTMVPPTSSATRWTTSRRRSMARPWSSWPPWWAPPRAARTRGRASRRRRQPQDKDLRQDHGAAPTKIYDNAMEQLTAMIDASESCENAWKGEEDSLPYFILDERGVYIIITAPLNPYSRPLKAADAPHPPLSR